MLKENEDMVTPNFLIEYTIASQSFGKIKLQPHLAARKIMIEQLNKKLGDENAD